jgi:hypothetical protein
MQRDHAQSGRNDFGQGAQEPIKSLISIVRISLIYAAVDPLSKEGYLTIFQKDWFAAMLVLN